MESYFAKFNDLQYYGRLKIKFTLHKLLTQLTQVLLESDRNAIKDESTHNYHYSHCRNYGE